MTLPFLSHRKSFTGTLLACVLLAGCSSSAPEQSKTEFQMGEKAIIGSLTYTVADANWKSQLGDMFKVRTPERRFLEISLSVTNNTNREISLPMLALENSNGESFTEQENGEGVVQWLGLIRNISPGQTEQGKVLFDVPLTSYRLQLPDGADPGSETYGYVTIPLRMDVDTQVRTPMPGQDN